MGDDKRRQTLLKLGEACQRNRIALGAEVGGHPGRSLAAGRHDSAGRRHIDAVERIERISILGRDLQYHVVLINWSIDRRDLLLAEGAVQYFINRRHIDTVARGRFAIHRDHDLLAEILLIGGDVGQIRLLAQFGDKPIGPAAQFLIVDILKNVLVLRSGLPGFDLDILHRLQMQCDVVHARDRSPQPLHDLCRRRMPPVGRTDVDIKPTAVERRILGVDADEARHADDVRILGDDVGDFLLQRRHAVERNILGRIGHAGDKTGVLLGHKTFGNGGVQPDAGEKGQIS